MSVVVDAPELSPWVSSSLSVVSTVTDIFKSCHTCNNPPVHASVSDGIPFTGYLPEWYDFDPSLPVSVWCALLWFVCLDHLQSIHAALGLA